MVWRKLSEKEVEFIRKHGPETIHDNIFHCDRCEPFWDFVPKPAQPDDNPWEIRIPLVLYYWVGTHQTNFYYETRYPVVGFCPLCGKIHGRGKWRIPRGIVDPENFRALFGLGMSYDERMNLQDDEFSTPEPVKAGDGDDPETYGY